MTEWTCGLRPHVELVHLHGSAITIMALSRGCGYDTDHATLTRDELYALVWSQPIQKLSKRYNIADRGLGKVPRRRKLLIVDF